MSQKCRKDMKWAFQDCLKWTAKQRVTRNGEGRKLRTGPFPCLQPLGCIVFMVAFFHHPHPYIYLSWRCKPSHECHPHSLIQRIWLVGRNTGFVASQSLPLRIPMYAALNGDYLEGKRSNHYLALALKTLSFNPKTLTGPIFPLWRVNHYPNLLLSAPSHVPTQE